MQRVDEGSREPLHPTDGGSLASLLVRLKNIDQILEEIIEEEPTWHSAFHPQPQ